MGGGGGGNSKYRGTTGDTEIEREGHRGRDTERDGGGGAGIASTEGLQETLR